MKKVSVVIPVYNEVRTIEKVIRQIEAVDVPKEIIIVDDCSTDGTREVLQKLKRNGIEVFFHDKNSGKGAALRTGFEHITGDVVIIQDADLEYDPQDYVKMIKLIQEDGVEVVYGSRFLEKNAFPGFKQFFHVTHFIANKFLSFLVTLLYRVKITDMETCYKMFKKEVLKNLDLSANGFDFEPEITAQILRKGFKIYEVPISYSPRNYREGKKISWKDGIVALGVLLKYRFKRIV